MFRQKKAPIIRPPDMAADPFDAVPVVTDGVVSTPAASSDCLVLMRQIRPRGGRAYRAISRWLGYNHRVSLQLDTRGSFFWRQIDGSRNLRQIGCALQQEFSLSEGECRKAAVLFVKDLMVRHFILLEVPRRPRRTEQG